ncbi:MAG: hypothetical protein MSH23_04975 [Campylobacter lanienae]|nr:hypothetical protein [Campylobacter lanienae]
MQSFICDLFDLKFQGITNKNIKTSFTFNNWYNSIIDDAGFCNYHNLKDKSGSRHCLIDFNMLNNMINFAKSMYEKYGKKISITFITDGFDTRMYNIINSDNFKIELKN